MECQKQFVSSIHDPEYQMIVNALIQLRETKKVSQAEIARAIGLTQPDVSKIERKERRIDILEVLRWIRYTKTNPAEFFAQFSNLENQA